MLRASSTMECSQQAAQTTNRSLLMASSVKVFPGRPTNSGSTLPGAVYLDGGMIGSHRCITWHSGSAPASPDMRPTPTALSHIHTVHHPTPISTTNYSHAPTVASSSAFHTQLYRFLRCLWQLSNNFLCMPVFRACCACRR